MKNKRLQFGLPDKVEGFLVGALIFLLFLIDILQNKIQDFGLDYVVTYATAGKVIPAIDIFWIAVFLFTIVAVFLFSRSIWQGRTDRKIDIVFGVIMFVGLILLIAGAIGAFLYKAPEGVIWFYGIPQITFYHIGMLMEIIAGMYFAITK
jgi:hypothetical protein